MTWLVTSDAGLAPSARYSESNFESTLLFYKGTPHAWSRLFGTRQASRRDLVMSALLDAQASWALSLRCCFGAASALCAVAFPWLAEGGQVIPPVRICYLKHTAPSVPVSGESGRNPFGIRPLFSCAVDLELELAVPAIPGYHYSRTNIALPARVGDSQGGLHLFNRW